MSTPPAKSHNTSHYQEIHVTVESDDYQGEIGMSRWSKDERSMACATLAGATERRWTVRAYETLFINLKQGRVKSTFGERQAESFLG